MVLTGAEAVVENGGIINKLGTYGIALAAKVGVACDAPPREPGCGTRPSALKGPLTLLLAATVASVERARHCR